jgi:cbb3-type cytochrome oxidase subunit 3
MAKKILIIVLVLCILIYALFLYWSRARPIDPELQKEFNANIPECAESELLAKRLRELNRDYYYENELNEITRRSKECLDKIPTYLNKKKNHAKN